MNFKISISNYFIGNIPPQNLPDLAIKAIQEGYDSESLIILAGMNEKDDSGELDQYFKDALSELDIPQKNDHSVKQLIEYSLRDILEKKIERGKGIDQIVWNILDKSEGFQKTNNMLYDEFDFNRVYALYDQIMDLSDSTHQWKEGKTNEELKEEMEEELTQEIKNWINKNGT